LEALTRLEQVKTSRSRKRPPLLTASSRGYGRAYEILFSRAGARAAVNGRDSGPLRPLAEDFCEVGGDAIPTISLSGKGTRQFLLRARNPGICVNSSEGSKLGNVFIPGLELAGCPERQFVELGITDQLDSSRHDFQPS
jgi:hypothetical protein